MAVQGIFTSNMGILGERVGDFSSARLRIDPTGNAPLLALTSGMPKESATDVTFSWTEEGHEAGRQKAVSGGTTTTVVVADASFYPPNTILLVEETGEHLFVTAVAGNSLTVVRGLGGTAIVAITNAHNVQKIGNAFEEGSAGPTPVSQNGFLRNNLVQIFRNGWAITGTAKAIKYHTGSKLANNKQDCATYHAEDMERSFIWGRKALSVLNNRQFRLTDGILPQIEQYGGVVKTAATGGTPGDLSQEDFESFIEEVFRYNIKGQPNERIAFCGNGALKVVNMWPKLNGVLNYETGLTQIGINVTKVITPFGKLNLMTHTLMNENPVWTNEMYVLHPGAIKKRMLRDTFKEEWDKHGNGIAGRDADEGAITTEGGIQVGAANTMGIMRNMKKGVKAA